MNTRVPGLNAFPSAAIYPPMAVSMRKHDDEAVRGFDLEVRYRISYQNETHFIHDSGCSDRIACLQLIVIIYITSYPFHK